MAMKAYLADLLTGRMLVELPFTKCSWSQTLNDTDSVSVTIPMSARRMRSRADVSILDLRNIATIGMTAIIVEDDGITVGGPLMQRSYDSDEQTLSLEASGLWTYYDHRTILPAEAKTKALIDADGNPDTSLDTTYTKTTWNTIVRNLVEQADSWNTRSMPIVYEDKTSGDNEMSYSAVDLTRVGEALTNITERQNGVDIGFYPRRTLDNLGWEWLLLTGHSLLGGEEHRISTTSPNMAAGGLQGTDSGDDYASWCWFTAGKSDDRTLVCSAHNDTMVNIGAPIWESVDSSHSSVKLLATLQNYANQAAAVYWKPVSGTELKLHRGYLEKTNHMAGDYNVGDYISFSTSGDPYYYDGWHRRRILGLSATSEDDWLTFTLGEVFDGVKVEV